MVLVVLQRALPVAMARFWPLKRSVSETLVDSVSPRKYLCESFPDENTTFLLTNFPGVFTIEVDDMEKTWTCGKEGGMISDKCYSMTQASQHLPDILNFVEQGHSVEVTRRGKSVAIVVSMTEYQSLREQSQGDFWQALQAFRHQGTDDFTEWHEALADVRENSQGRDMVW